MTSSPTRIPEEAVSHYNEGREDARLRDISGQLEFARTAELLQRYLPSAPATIADVGGGTGPYSFWLAARGYSVHLIDIVPLHIEQARQSAQASALASISSGDARQLNFANASLDGVLLMGPLYHLTERADRLQALREAYRVLRPEGVVIAVGISRFASALDGLWRGFLRDPEFLPIVERDLAEGQHRNSQNHPHYFTTAFLHHPEELPAEVRAAGFAVEATLAIEGPGWLVPDFADWWQEARQREILLQILRLVEQEASLLGSSAHFMTVGRKRG